LPAGKDAPEFKPVQVKRGLPDPSTQLWPMGDVLPKEPPPAGLDMAKVNQALDAAFEPSAAMTAAFVVTWKGRLIAERYGKGITMHTPLESWSMGKSVTAALMGILVRQGVYELSQPAPVPEWQRRGDPRRRIRTTTPRAAIPITSTSTPAPSTLSSMPPRGRCSGLRAPSGATATATR